MSKRISDEDGLQLLKDNLKLFNGKIPTKNEYESMKCKPSHNWYSKRFGSFGNAIEILGLYAGNRHHVLKMTREDLAKIIYNKYQVLGRSPYASEMKNPTEEAYYTRFKTKSWNKVLSMLGLPLNWSVWDKEEVIAQYKNLYAKLGRIPTRKEISNTHNCPSADWIYNNGFTINSFYYSLGLADKPLTVAERIEISISKLQELAKQLHRCPSVNEFDKIVHMGLKRRALENRLNMKYNDICRKYLSQYHLNIDMDNLINKEDIIESLNRVQKEFGYMLSFKEYNKLNYSYSYDTFQRAFNKTYNQVIEELGYTPYGSTTVTRNNQQMIDDFLRLFYLLNRLPFTTEFSQSNNICSFSNYKNKFGTYENLCKIAGVDWNIYGNNRELKDSLGNACNSKIEIIIGNYLIDNKLYYEKETPYKNIIHNKNDNRRFDWTIIDYNNNKFYVEYFGLYEKIPKSSLTKYYSKKMRKKIKDIYKSGIIQNCIFLFPIDILAKTEQEVHKNLDKIFNNKLKLIKIEE